MRTAADLPLRWRILDGIEEAVACVWTARFQGYTPYLLLIPAIAVVSLLAIGMGMILDMSFRELDRMTFHLSDYYTLANYVNIAQNEIFAIVTLRSLISAILVTVIVLVLAFPYAYVMVRTPNAWKRKALLFCLFLPFFIGQVVRGYSWIVVLGREGMIDSTLRSLGIPPLGLLFTPPAVIIGLVQYMMPFAVLLLAPALTAVPEEVELAAESLGASWPRAFRRVVLPMAKPGIVSASIVVFTIALTDYAMPAMMGGGRFDFIANFIYTLFFDVSDYGLGAVLVVLLVLIGSGAVAGIFFLLEFKRLSRRPKR